MIRSIKEISDRVTEYTNGDIPTQAYFGTIWLSNSDTGTLVKCYNYINVDYKIHPMATSCSQRIICIWIHILHSMDRIYFPNGDCEMTDQDAFHKIIEDVRKDGFKIFIQD